MRDFNGSSDNLSMGNDTAIEQNLPMTVAAWINTDSTAATYRWIISRGRFSGSAVRGWGFGMHNDELDFLKATVVAIDSTTLNITTGTDILVGCVLTSTNAHFFKHDGTLTTQDIADSNAFGATTASESRIGCGLTAFGVNQEFWDGRIGEVMVTYTALTDAQLETMYRYGAASATIGQKRGYWKIRGATSPELDYSGFGFSATASGTTAAADPAPVIAWDHLTTKRPTPPPIMIPGYGRMRFYKPPIFYSSAAQGLLAFELSLDPGAYTLTGAETTLLVDRLLSLDSGVYTLSGADATLLATYGLNLEPGTYTLAGAEATLLADYLMNAEPGAYVLTGADLTVTVTTANLHIWRARRR